MVIISLSKYQSCSEKNPETMTKSYQDCRHCIPTRNAEVQIRPTQLSSLNNKKQTTGLPGDSEKGQTRGIWLREMHDQWPTRARGACRPPSIQSQPSQPRGLLTQRGLSVAEMVKTSPHALSGRRALAPPEPTGQAETGVVEHQLESTQGALTQVRTPLAWQELADWPGALTTASAVQTACESLPPFFLLLISCGDTCGPWVTSVLSM